MLRRIRNALAAAVLVSTPMATVLLPGVAHALPSAYCEWTGSFNSDWDDETNWTSVNSGCTGTSVMNSGVATADPNSVPGNGDNLVFGNVVTTNDPSNNNLTGLSVGSIDFEAVSADQLVDGNAFTLTGDITNNSGSSESISNDVAITSSVVMDMGSAASLNFNGTVSGSGAITKNGAGSVGFFGDFTNTGALTINAGEVSVTATSSADFTGASVTVASGATFAYDAFFASSTSTYTLSTPINSAGGTLDFQTDGTGPYTLNLTGTITLTGNTNILSSAGTTIHVKGPLHGPGFKLVATGSNGQVLNESTDNNTDTPSGDLNPGAPAADNTAPATPDTGFALVAANPAATLAITLASAAGIAYAARMIRKQAN